jgi:hypothetical protein
VATIKYKKPFYTRKNIRKIIKLHEKIEGDEKNVAKFS